MDVDLFDDLGEILRPDERATPPTSRCEGSNPALAEVD
jgi:hypothetical protein